MSRSARKTAAVLVLAGLAGCSLAQPLPAGEALTQQERLDAIGRAAVWAPTDIRRVNFKTGPQGRDAFAPNELISCEYGNSENLGGNSPKFECEMAGDREIRVKYGVGNAEVFGEVLSTRLFWALGFPADHAYPVRVRCRGCPEILEAQAQRAGDDAIFDPATVERRYPGRTMETEPDSGWSWSELENIGPAAPRDARAHRDGLKLLAAFIQHTDSKAANQRLLCPPGRERGGSCLAPVMMIGDLGLTFGHSNFLNRNQNSVSLATWAKVPVWRDPGRCVAELQGSLTGSLRDPTISEAGRAFLAGLLVQLTDRQLRDLFESARVKRRPRDPGDKTDEANPPASVEAWVNAFKAKREQIVAHRCPE